MRRTTFELGVGYETDLEAAQRVIAKAALGVEGVRHNPAPEALVRSFEDSWITEYRMFKAPFAQPIVTLGYPDRLPSHQTPVTNLFLANMSQVYPQDRGQNYSIAMAERLIHSLPVSTTSS